jgi:two-component system response regulator
MMNKPILLVEDNPSDIDLTKRAFVKGNIHNEIIVVEDGQEALDYIFCQGQYRLREKDQLPALVLLDLKLPKVDGLEVLKKIRAVEKIKRLPVVVLTSSKEEKDITTSYDLGANSYIRKPVDFTQFALAIQSLGNYWLVINEQPLYV